MGQRYLYTTLRIERAGWPRLAEQVNGPLAEQIASVGGSVFGLFRGEIGWANDEGALVTAWSGQPDASPLHAIPGVLEASSEPIEATVRPTSPTPPTAAGIYAHRWFETTEADWPEFLDLSNSAWPTFEGAFDANIIGFWRTGTDPVRVLLLTRYGSLAEWERSRPYADRRVPGTDPARERFLRRAELTLRTVVRVTRLV